MHNGNLGKIVRWPRFLGSLLIATLLTGGLTAQEAPVAVNTPVKPDVAKLFAGQAPRSIADLKAMQQQVRTVAEKVIASTVAVQIGSAQGSGVIVSSDGYVLTAGHVVGRPGRDVTFILHDGETVKGKTLGMDQAVDSGLMKITEGGPWPHLELGNSAELKQGQWCLAAGHPGGFQPNRKPVVRLGRVLASRTKAVTTDCTLIGGDSGGPLLDLQARVIAINSRIGQPLTANMHVPVDLYRDNWQRLVKGEAWGFGLGEGPYIGVEGVRDAPNAEIARVFDNSPAAKAGVEPGDVIVEFHGQPVDDFLDLSAAVRTTAPGQKVQLKVLRNEETVELDLRVGQRGG